MNINLDFGSLIKEHRKKKGISQEEFSDKLGRHKSFALRIEKKQDIVDTKKIRKLLNDISDTLNLDNQQRLELEISSGILPYALLDSLADEKVISLFTELANQKLSEKVRKKLVNELNVSLSFLRHFITADRVLK